MAPRALPRISAFFTDNLPLGDRLGEAFYAVWMVVVSLGILGGTGFEGGAIAYVIIIAFAVNLTWGLVDGITVMHSYIIERRQSEELVHDLQTAGGEEVRKKAVEALGEGITGALSNDDRMKVADMIAATPPGEDPRTKRYRAQREDWDYFIGILTIDVLLVVPLVLPFLMFPNPYTALYMSRILATVLFAALGVLYARELNRNRLLAALFLGTLCFSLFTAAYLSGW